MTKLGSETLLATLELEQEKDGRDYRSHPVQPLHFIQKLHDLTRIKELVSGRVARSPKSSFSDFSNLSNAFPPTPII